MFEYGLVYRYSLLAVFLLFWLTACRPGGDVDQSKAEVVRPVIYHTVEASDGSTIRSFPARVSASNLRELNFPVSGVVLSIPVDEAEAVSEGQLLAQLDARDYASALSAVKARVENATQELARAQRLFQEDAIAKSVLEQRGAAAEVASAELKAAEKALADTRILAPFDGVISRVFVSESQSVTPGAPAIRIFSRDELEATIAVPASLIVNADGSRKEEGRGLVRLDADPDRPIEAKFKTAELEADAGSQSYAVTFGFQSPEDLMVLPGMNAEVELTLRGRNAAAAGVKVPLRAIAVQGNTRLVWVIDTESEPNRVSRRKVEVGASVGETLPIESGLEPGESIVAAGVSEIVDGMAVRQWSASAE